MSESIPVFRLDVPENDCRWIAVQEATGSGKTLISVGVAVTFARKNHLPIHSNITIQAEEVQVQKIRTAIDLLQAKNGVLLWDEADKAAHGRAFQERWNIAITELAGDARHNEIRLVILNTTARRGIDYNLRENVTQVLIPSRAVEVRGEPVFPRSVEIDGKHYPTLLVFSNYETYFDWKNLGIQRAERILDYAKLMRLDISVEEVSQMYDTLEKVPVQVSVSLEAQEREDFVRRFLKWCRKEKILWDASGKLISLNLSLIDTHFSRWLQVRRDARERKMLFLAPGETIILRSMIVGVGERQRQKVRAAKTPVKMPFQQCECGKRLKGENMKRHTEKTNHRTVETEKVERPPDENFSDEDVEDIRFEEFMEKTQPVEVSE